MDLMGKEGGGGKVAFYAEAKDSAALGAAVEVKTKIPKHEAARSQTRWLHFLSRGGRRKLPLEERGSAGAGVQTRV